MRVGASVKMTTLESAIARQVAGRYNLHGVGVRNLGTLVNDVVAVAAAEGEFALKLYHRIRTPKAVQWEIDLLIHLHRCGAPAVQPIRGREWLPRIPHRRWTAARRRHPLRLAAPGQRPRLLLR